MSSCYGDSLGNQSSYWEEEEEQDWEAQEKQVEGEEVNEEEEEDVEQEEEESCDSSNVSYEQPTARKAQSSASSAPSTKSKQSADNNEASNVFAIKIENLPSRTKDASVKQELSDQFKTYGKVTVVLSSGGTFKQRYALAFFYNQEHQEKALEALQGKEILGSQIKLSIWTPGSEPSTAKKRKRKPQPNPIPEMCGGGALEKVEYGPSTFCHPSASCSLFVQNLEHSTTGGQMRQLFQRFGELLDIKVMEMKGSTTCAYLQFSNITNVCKAIIKMDGCTFGSNQLRLSFGRGQPRSCLWLADLPVDATQDKLMTHFTRYGTVEEVVLDKKRRKALIKFAEKDDAINALKETKFMNIGGKRVMCDFASRKLQLSVEKAIEKSMKASAQHTGKINDIPAAKSAAKNLSTVTSGTGLHQRTLDQTSLPATHRSANISVAKNFSTVMTGMGLHQWTLNQTQLPTISRSVNIRDEQKATYHGHSTESSHYTPVRETPTYQQNFGLGHSSQSREFYPKLDPLSRYYHGSQHNDDQLTHQEYSRGPYENTSDNWQRGQKRSHDWAESGHGREDWRRPFEQRPSPAYSKMTPRYTF